MVDLFQPDHLHLGERQDELPPIHSRPPTRNEFAINIPDLLMEPGQCAVQRAPEPSHHYGHYVQNSIVDTPTPTRDEFVIDIDNLPTYPEACAVRKQTQPVIDTGLEGGASTDPPESPDSTAEPRYRKPNASLRTQLHRLWSPTWRWLALLLVLGTLAAVIVGICAVNMKLW